MQIILASQSPYRRKQLRDFGIKFRALKPQFDEAQFKKKSTRLSPKKLAVILAKGKALSLARRYPNACIIGSDQLVALNRQILGKPGQRAKAIKQLRSMSGRTHLLITAVAVCYQDQIHTHVDVARIRIRKLSNKAIEKYLDHDKPWDCAGSYKFEKRGLELVESMALKDPSALIGLPLISLGKILRLIESE